MRIFCSTCQLFWCFPQPIFADFRFENSNFKFFKGKKILLKLETIVCIFWGKLFTIHRKGCDLVKISWAFAVNLPEFLHRDSWKPPIRWTPLFTAECVWLADVFDHLILPTFWSWYILFRSNLFFSFNII